MQSFFVIAIVQLLYEIKKSNQIFITCTRGITPKRVTSGRAHLRSLASGQHISEEMAVASRWRHSAKLTGLRIEPQTSSTDSVRLATELIGNVGVKGQVHVISNDDEPEPKGNMMICLTSIR